MAPRPCLDCGKLAPTSPCPTCTRQRDTKRNARRTWYHGDWQRESKQARDEWVAEHGWVCPGMGRPAHLATSLQLDHSTGKVLCGPCNVAAGPARH